MGYTLSEDSSADSLDDYTTGVVASLTAHAKRVPATAELIPPWTAMQQMVREHINERRLLRDEVIFARAWVNITDVYWDKDLGACSSESYHVSGKKADKNPYRSMFGTIKATSAKQFGPEKATQFGDDLIARTKVLNHDGLKTVITQFEGTNEELKDAANVRAQTIQATQLHTLKTQQLIPTIQELMDKTEVELLKIDPGNDALVRAILSPWES